MLTGWWRSGTPSSSGCPATCSREVSTCSRAVSTCSREVSTKSRTRSRLPERARGRRWQRRRAGGARCQCAPPTASRSAERHPEVGHPERREGTLAREPAERSYVVELPPAAAGEHLGAARERGHDLLAGPVVLVGSLLPGRALERRAHGGMRDVG